MSTNRSKLTNELLLEDVTVLRELADTLEEIAVNGTSIEKAAEKHGYSQMRLRDVIHSLQSLKHDQNRFQGKQLHVNYNLSYILSPAEKAYKEIFDLDDKEFAEIKLPEDFEETLTKISEETLSPRSLDIFNRRINGEILDDIAAKHNITRERTRQIYAKAIRLMRSPRNQEILRLGLKEYQKQDLEKQKEKEKTEQLLREEEKIRENTFREEARKIAQEKASNFSQEAELEELILDYFLSKESSNTQHGVCFMKGWENIPIEKLDLSVRSYNCLHRAGCVTLGNVDKMIKERKLPNVRNLGRKSEEEVLEKFHAYTGI